MSLMLKLVVVCVIFYVVSYLYKQQELINSTASSSVKKNQSNVVFYVFLTFVSIFLSFKLIDVAYHWEPIRQVDVYESKIDDIYFDNLREVLKVTNSKKSETYDLSSKSVDLTYFYDVKIDTDLKNEDEKSDIEYVKVVTTYQKLKIFGFETSSTKDLKTNIEMKEIVYVNNVDNYQNAISRIKNATASIKGIIKKIVE